MRPMNTGLSATDMDEAYEHLAVCNGEVMTCCILGFDHVDNRMIDD